MTFAFLPTANILPSSIMTTLPMTGARWSSAKHREKVIESPLFESVQGLSWGPSGEEVWFTSPLESGDLHAFTLSGKSRTPLAVPGRLRLMDIGTNGELLVAQGVVHRGFVVSSSNGEAERDLSWLDYSFGRAVSGDGKMVLFEEEGNEARHDTVFVRNVDGSPAVPLGEGYGMALSPDKNWALAQKMTQPTQEVWLLPSGQVSLGASVRQIYRPG